jgi:hypothetical protein
MMSFITSRFPGNVRVRKRKNHKHCPIIEWEAVGEKARDFLEIIGPYLVVKKKQALLALEYRHLQEKIKLNGHREKGVQVITDEDNVRRAELMIEMRELNKFGRRNDSVMRDLVQ